MPIYQVSLFQEEMVFIVKADSEEDVRAVLENGRYRVDGKTIFSRSDAEDIRELERIIKIGD